MNLNGRFGRVSTTTYRDGVVLVGFLGNVYPHDLTAENIKWLKGMYNMPQDCKHTIFLEWPDGIEAAYPAAKKNFKNGFILFEA